MRFNGILYRELGQASLIAKGKTVMNLDDPKFQSVMWYMTYALVLYSCATQANNYVTPNYFAIYGGIIFGTVMPITAASYLIFKPSPSLKIMVSHWLKAAMSGGVGILANQMDFTIVEIFMIALLYFLVFYYFH